MSMTTERIQAWVAAVGPEEARKRTGVSQTTLGRYTSGDRLPKGSSLITFTVAIEAWERAGAKS